MYFPQPQGSNTGMIVMGIFMFLFFLSTVSLGILFPMYIYNWGNLLRKPSIGESCELDKDDPTDIQGNCLDGLSCFDEKCQCPNQIPIVPRETPPNE